MNRTAVAALAVLALMATVVPPAAAAPAPYDDAYAWSFGSAGSAGGTWSGAESADRLTGAVSASVTVDDPTLTLDNQPAWGSSVAIAENLLPLEAGRYQVEVTLTGVDAAVSAWGVADAAVVAEFSIGCWCDGPDDMHDWETPSVTVLDTDHVKRSASVTDETVVLSGVVDVSVPTTVILGGKLHVYVFSKSLQSSFDLMHYGGGTASGSGVVADISATPL